jgi:hypothetical protein
VRVKEGREEAKRGTVGVSGIGGEMCPCDFR